MCVFCSFTVHFSFCTRSENKSSLMNEALNSIFTRHHRGPCIVLSILNRTVPSLCFWFHLLVDKWNYVVLQITGMQDDILVITLIYTDIHLNRQKPKGRTASLFSLLLQGRKTLLLSNCRLFWFWGYLLQHRVKKVILIFHQQTGYSYGAQELPWSSSRPQISLQPVNGSCY